MAIHKPLFFYSFTENKKKSLLFAPFVIARLRRSRGNPQPLITNTKTEKKKKLLFIKLKN